MSSINMYKYKYIHIRPASREISLKDVSHGKKDCHCRKCHCQKMQKNIKDLIHCGSNKS